MSMKVHFNATRNGSNHQAFCGTTKKENDLIYTDNWNLVTCKNCLAYKKILSVYKMNTFNTPKPNFKKFYFVKLNNMDFPENISIYRPHSSRIDMDENKQVRTTIMGATAFMHISDAINFLYKEMDGEGVIIPFEVDINNVLETHKGEADDSLLNQG